MILGGIPHGGTLKRTYCAIIEGHIDMMELYWVSYLHTVSLDPAVSIVNIGCMMIHSTLQDHGVECTILDYYGVILS